MSQNDKAAVQAVSRKVVEAVALGDSPSLSANLDREAWRFDLRSDPTNKVVSINSLITFGNSRLAFVLMSWVSRGERSFGMDHLALVLRKVDDLWKVLLYLPGALPDLEDILMSFDHMGLKNGQPDAIAQVSLVSPVDHARITRFPNNSELVWKPLNPSPAAYVFQSQFLFLEQETWSSGRIWVVSPSRGESTIMKMPFGTGRQPHRWRVWAISGTGFVSTSNRRTVDFTN
jgi:hypothetical protein